MGVGVICGDRQTNILIHRKSYKIRKPW